MARLVRPRTLAVIFGIYFLAVAYFSRTFANGLTTPWYAADLTRTVYTTYMLVSAIFLVGLGGLALSIRRSFGRQIRALEARGPGRSGGPIPDALPPPLPETTTVPDHVDRDIDELLESLSEVEASAARDAQAMDAQPSGVPPPVEATDREIAAKRARIVKRQKLLGRYVAGPGVVVAVVLGISGIMLPASDVFAQDQFALNTALILGIGYSWIGVGVYVAATIAALVSSTDEKRGR